MPKSKETSPFVRGESLYHDAAVAINSWSEVMLPEDVVRNLVSLLAQAMVNTAADGHLPIFVGLVLTDFAQDIQKYQALAAMDAASAHEAGHA